MMLGWRLLVLVIHSLMLNLTNSGANCSNYIIVFTYGRIFSFSFNIISDIFQTMFGLPSECVHHNVIHQCRLSFSCWLQGGIHATGCGSNKWLFSCCLTENDIFSVDYGIRNKNVVQPPTINFKFSKKNILRRRTDDLNQVN